MARTHVTRTFTETDVTFTRFTIENGTIIQGEAETATIDSKITDPQKAMKQVPLDGAAGIVILAMEHKNSFYSMPIVQFKSLAERTEEEPDDPSDDSDED